MFGGFTLEQSVCGGKESFGFIAGGGRAGMRSQQGADGARVWALLQRLEVIGVLCVYWFIMGYAVVHHGLCGGASWVIHPQFFHFSKDLRDAVFKK